MGNKFDVLLEEMAANPANVRFSDLAKLCDHFFGNPRQSRTSHRIYKKPWPSDPRINIQNNRGKAKIYQVKQVLLGIEKLRRVENGG